QRRRAPLDRPRQRRAPLQPAADRRRRRASSAPRRRPALRPHLRRQGARPGRGAGQRAQARGALDMIAASLTPDEPQPVPTWTRTLNDEDAALLLDLAWPGMSLDTWQEQGHAVLPQPSLPRRREQLRLVREELLDH